MKKYVLLVVLCFALSFNVIADASSRMIFTNKETEMPDLYITKTVKSSDAAPEDTEFTFEVKVDGVPYANQEYEVYAEDGTEVETKRTDQNGEVVLKKDQKARFVYVGVGKTYEVTETSKIEGYTQIIPAEGSSYVGTITTKGAAAAFTNEYIDPTVATEYTELKVSKRITVPAGYDMGNETFSFALLLEGKMCAGMEYEVYDLDSDVFVKNGVTDENGGFFLDGGQYALFSDVETGIDYEVKETEKEGWWCNNPDVKGVTQSVRTNVEFNNSQTSFLVTKKMDDGSNPDETFTFQLTDGNNVVWKDAHYYLYSTKGECLNHELQTTDDQGCFFLKAGEAAVFVGIEPGTKYNVKELPLRGYSQIIPASSDGYTEKTVNGTVEELPFVNHEDVTKGSLMVTKKVSNADENTPSEAAEFTFLISKVTKDENDIETVSPVSGASYERTEGTETIYNLTDENGYFKLKAGETVRFTSLRSGEYQIEEVVDQMSRNYYTDESQRVQRQTLKMSDADGVYFEFENVFKMHKLDILLHKVSNTDGAALQNAVFRLYKDEKLEQEYTPEENWSGYVSDENGDVLIKELPLGTYYLKETKAPTGYGLAEKIHKIEIARKGDSYHAVIYGTESSLQDGAVIPLTLGETRYENGEAVLENDLAEYTFKDREKKKCSIKVTKYDGSKNTLEGVTFTLTAEDGTTIDGVTDENGEMLFENLEEGRYQLTETSTKSGLSLLSEPVQITLPYHCLVEDAEEMKLDTSNAEFVSTEDAWFFYDLTYSITNTATLDLPQTGSNWMLLTVGGGILFFIITVIVFIKEGEKNHE